jgi:septin family protein
MVWINTLLRIDIEENGVRLHLTVVDTPGFGDFVNNDDRYVLSPILNYRWQFYLMCDL